MSFTSDTKQELLTIEQKPCCNIAMLSALLAINGHLSLSNDGMGLVFQTTSLPLARKVIKLIKNLYHIEVEVLSKQQLKLKKKPQYHVIIKDKTMKMMRELGLMDEDHGFAYSIDETLILKECDQRAYLRGAFLASGSINHPGSSSYHLEIASQNEAFGESLTELLNKFHLNAKTLTKKKGVISYIKESEKISDFLRIVSATNSLLMFEDERIKRDFVNSITRVMNMELANQNKTLEAADKQLKNIAILENLVDMAKLSKGVHEAIMLRKKYPEASLLELSDYSRKHFNKQISKSGLNHRFRQIDALAQEALEGFNESRNRN